MLRILRVRFGLNQIGFAATARSSFVNGGSEIQKSLLEFLFLTIVSYTL